ncbi:TPA: HypC/HybG/HupF family hydrogenase formation chaperone, partial [Candidatus Micrarchaeota archaeon]|nr:HypC/HybG/HupF family hydrogenase formation chaperone [Candidatus Micrarchaeota archaeon]
MCYSIPGKVVSKSGTIATIDYFGERKTAADISGMCNIGNYAYAQGGVVVDVIPEEEAKRVLVGWKDKFIRLYHSDEV